MVELQQAFANVTSKLAAVPSAEAVKNACTHTGLTTKTNMLEAWKVLAREVAISVKAKSGAITKLLEEGEAKMKTLVENARKSQPADDVADAVLTFLRGADGGAAAGGAAAGGAAAVGGDGGGEEEGGGGGGLAAA